MEHELEQLQEQMNTEIKAIKEKYNQLKKEVKAKYKETKPKKPRTTIPKSVKDNLWDQHFGKEAGVGKCYCCESEINSKKFDCGHIISVADGGTNNIDNLKPICSTCNKSMGTQNMELFKKEYFEKNKDKFEKCKYCHDLVSECDKKAQSMTTRGVYGVGIIDKYNTRCKGYIERSHKTSHGKGSDICMGCCKSIYDCDTSIHNKMSIQRNGFGDDYSMMGRTGCSQYKIRNNVNTNKFF